MTVLSSLFRPTQGLGKASLRSFTLIELLVVIAILAVLAIAVVLVLNPVELIKESRDTTRIEDLGTVNYALSLLQTDQTNAFFGTSTIVYVSIPDTTTTCANLGLPSLPSGYTYGCAPTSTYRKADATGWIPVDFFSISYGSPLSKLPIDPVNTTSTGLYYTYIPGGSWELTALMESTKRRLGGEKDVASTDGGDTYGVYEVGTTLTANPVNDTGLVGYWKLDETSGTFADSSGNGNTGTQSGGVTYGQEGKVNKAVGFDGVNDYVSISTNVGFPSSSEDRTVTAWVYMRSRGTAPYHHVFHYGNALSGQSWGIAIKGSNGAILAHEWGVYQSYGIVPLNQWTMLTITMTNNTKNHYINGISVGISAYTASTTLVLTPKIGTRVSPGEYFNGFIDDLRIYNRALSAAEIQALYNATR